ncbi:MAG: L,D-transpeptidase [Solirubrobacteraceae bacterium]
MSDEPGAQAHDPGSPTPGSGGSPPRRRRSLAIAGLVVAVVAVPVVAGLLIGLSGGGSSSTSTPGLTAVTTAAQPPTLARPKSTIPGGPGTLVAIVRRATTMRTAPAGGRLAKLGIHTGFGSREVMWVVSHVPGWLGVISPLAGNGHLGWIPQSATTLTRVTWTLKVALAARRLTVLHGGRVLARYVIAVGSAAAPTPTGRFAVTDRLSTGDPSGPYGCCILALSAHSPHAIAGWTGGNRIAIHSTPETESIGQPDSHGCIRVTLAEGRWLLAHVPLGTPTLISS